MHYVHRYADASSSPSSPVATSSFGYDTSNRLEYLTYAVATSGTTQYISYGWSFDNANRVSGLSYTSDFNAAFNNVASYSYDAASQLTAADHTDQADESFGYDPNGNKLVGGVSSAPTGTNNQLQTDGTYNYTYDGEGNRISRTRITPISGAMDNITLYTWDYRNRLASVVSMSDSETVLQTVTYAYAPNNLRIGEVIDKVVPGHDNQIEVQGFVYDGQNLALDFVAYNLATSPTLAHRYLYGDLVDQIFAQEDIDSLTGQSSAVLWQLTDNQGTVRDIVTGSATSEAQQITFDGVPAGGTWTITTVAGTTDSLAYNADLSTIQAALDALTPHANDIVVTGNYADGFTLTYSGTSYADQDVSEATVDDSALTMLTTEAPTVAEDIPGVAPADEIWILNLNVPVGAYTISGNGLSIDGYAAGSIDITTLQSDMETFYGSGNVIVSSNFGNYTVEFVGALANMPLDAPPSIGTVGLTSGSAFFSNVTTGFAGVQEVQTISLPSGLTGGIWTINGGSTLSSSASAEEVENYINNFGIPVAVTGDDGGPYTITWNAPGPQSLLTVQTAFDFWSTVSEYNAGQPASNEVWNLAVDSPTGTFTIYGNDTSVIDTADGSIDGSTLQADLESLYGSGNVTVSPSGSLSSGYFTVTFVGALSNTTINGSPSIDTYGLTGGSAEFDWVSTGSAGVQEQQMIALPSDATGGTWSINGGSGLAFNADAATVEAYLDSLLGQTVTVSGGSPYYLVAWASPGPQDLLTVDTSGLQFSAVSESTTGIDSHNEVWSFSVDVPEGTFVLYGNGSYIVDYASGSIYGSTLQADLETLYGSGNVTVSPGGAVASGSFTVTFVGELAAAPLSSLPYIDTSGVGSGAASFTRSVTGTAGASEVQIITLPSGLVGGTWQINGGDPLAFDASASTVESYLDSLLGQAVYVTGDVGGPFIVTWSDPGMQDLLTVANIDLQVPNSATTSTTQDGTIGTNYHFVYDSFGLIKAVRDGNGMAISDIGSVTSVLYAGYWHDKATNLDFTKNRPYDAFTHTFILPDPMERDGGYPNFYIYVGNNAVNLTDPTGYWPAGPSLPSGTGFQSGTSSQFRVGPTARPTPGGAAGRAGTGASSGSNVTIPQSQPQYLHEPSMDDRRAYTEWWIQRRRSEALDIRTKETSDRLISDAVNAGVPRVVAERILNQTGMGEPGKSKSAYPTNIEELQRITEEYRIKSAQLTAVNNSKTNPGAEILFRAPQKGKDELTQGFKPENFNTGNKTAFFAKDAFSASEYAGRRGYEDYIIEVIIPKAVYDAELRQYEAPLPGRPGKIEVEVPQSKFPLLNRSVRLKHESK